jgi:hypothetical protein
VKPLFLVLMPLVVLLGCASTAPTPIGGDTYYAAKTNTAGAFGDPTAVAGKLMVEGSQFCAAKGREFELVTQTISPSRVASSLGGASITFKCVEHANNPVMRPDNGVTTITHQ